MRSDLDILPEPDVDYLLRLFGAVEPSSIKHLLSKCPVDAFAISVLLWAAWIDWQWLDADSFPPILDVQRNELRLVVRTYELRFAMFYQHWVQCVENIVRSHLRSYRYAQRLTGVFIQNFTSSCGVLVAPISMDINFNAEVNHYTSNP